MFKLEVMNYDEYMPTVETIAVFESLRRLYEYVDTQIKDKSNNYRWEDFYVTEFKERKWYQRWLKGKRVSKQYEQLLSWSQICYWLDNHMVK